MNIQRIMDDKNITRYRLSKNSGIPYTTITDIISGKAQLEKCTAETIYKIAKEFRKINGKFMPAEIILIGGAAILVNYGFRDMTTDVDAIIHALSRCKK